MKIQTSIIFAAALLALPTTALSAKELKPIACSGESREKVYITYIGYDQYGDKGYGAAIHCIKPGASTTELGLSELRTRIRKTAGFQDALIWDVKILSE
jgi:hypothetical protein